MDGQVHTRGRIITRWNSVVVGHFGYAFVRPAAWSTPPHRRHTKDLYLRICILAVTVIHTNVCVSERKETRGGRRKRALLINSAGSGPGDLRREQKKAEIKWENFGDPRSPPFPVHFPVLEKR